MSFWVGLLLVAGFGFAFMGWCLVRSTDESIDEDRNMQRYIQELDKYNMRSRGQ